MQNTPERNVYSTIITLLTGLSDLVMNMGFTKADQKKAKTATRKSKSQPRGKVRQPTVAVTALT